MLSNLLGRLLILRLEVRILSNIHSLLIVNCRKLLCTLNDWCLVFQEIQQRWLWWIHTVVDVVGIVRDLVEEFAPEGVEGVVSEVCLDLQVQRSDQLSVLVLAPFLHVLLFLEGDELLSSKILQHAIAEIVVGILVLLDEILGLLVRALEVIFPQIQHSLQMLDNIASELVREGLLPATFDKIDAFEFQRLLLSLRLVSQADITEVLRIHRIVVFQLDHEVGTLAKSYGAELDVEGATLHL